MQADVRELTVFLEIARHLNFRRAAGALGRASGLTASNDCSQPGDTNAPLGGCFEGRFGLPSAALVSAFDTDVRHGRGMAASSFRWSGWELKSVARCSPEGE
ncbi:hypothetical protein D7Y21_30275 [Corallococcus sp. AB045]|nr:hypothetical protein D7Y21_30275 [Corallococcus sp. AB045]